MYYIKIRNGIKKKLQKFKRKNLKNNLWGKEEVITIQQEKRYQMWEFITQSGNLTTFWRHPFLNILNCEEHILFWLPLLLFKYWIENFIHTHLKVEKLRFYLVLIVKSGYMVKSQFAMQTYVCKFSHLPQKLISAS